MLICRCNFCISDTDRSAKDDPQGSPQKNAKKNATVGPLFVSLTKSFHNRTYRMPSASNSHVQPSTIAMNQYRSINALTNHK